MSNAVVASATQMEGGQEVTYRSTSIKQRIQRWFARRSYTDAPAFTVENLEMIESIGEGSFATVARAQDRVSHMEYAIKMINLLNFPEPEARAQIEQEQKIMELVNGHPLIVRLFHVWEIHDTKCFALEFVAGGDLFEILKKERRFSQHRSARYVLQLGKALDYLHSKGVIFRDLKLENILLDVSRDQIRLADFGLAKIVPAGLTTKTVCGTVQYMAPEIILSLAYDGRVDWWSLGVITYVFLVGKYPFNKGHGQIQNDRSEQDRVIMYKRILDGNIEFPTDITAAAADVVRELLHVDPGLRLHGIERLEMQEWFVLENLTLPPVSRPTTLVDIAEDREPEAQSISPTKSTPASKSASMISQASEELNCANFAQNFILNHIDDPTDQSSQQPAPSRLSGTVQANDRRRSRSPGSMQASENRRSRASAALSGIDQIPSGNRLSQMEPDTVNSQPLVEESRPRPKSSASIDHAISFFELIERIQGSRLDSQRSVRGGAPITMPLKEAEPFTPPTARSSTRFSIFRRRPGKSTKSSSASTAGAATSTVDQSPSETVVALDPIASIQTPETAVHIEPSPLAAEQTDVAVGANNGSENNPGSLSVLQLEEQVTVDLLAEIPELQVPTVVVESPADASNAISAAPEEKSPAFSRDSSAGSTFSSGGLQSSGGSRGWSERMAPKLRGRESLNAMSWEPTPSCLYIPGRVSQSPSSSLTATATVNTTLGNDTQEEGLSRSGSVLRVALAPSKTNFLTTFGPTVISMRLNDTGTTLPRASAADSTLERVQNGRKRTDGDSKLSSLDSSKLDSHGPNDKNSANMLPISAGSIDYATLDLSLTSFTSSSVSSLPYLRQSSGDGPIPSRQGSDTSDRLSKQTETGGFGRTGSSSLAVHNTFV